MSDSPCTQKAPARLNHQTRRQPPRAQQTRHKPYHSVILCNVSDPCPDRVPPEVMTNIRNLYLMLDLIAC